MCPASSEDIFRMEHDYGDALRMKFLGQESSGLAMLLFLGQRRNDGVTLREVTGRKYCEISRRYASVYSMQRTIVELLPLLSNKRRINNKRTKQPLTCDGHNPLPRPCSGSNAIQ